MAGTIRVKPAITEVQPVQEPTSTEAQMVADHKEFAAQVKQDFGITANPPEKCLKCQDFVGCTMMAILRAIGSEE